MKKIEDVTESEWACLVIHIEKKVLGNFQYPYPWGLTNYVNEVIESLRTICKKESLRKSLLKPRLEPVITIEFLPYFVVKWLIDNGFEIENILAQSVINTDFTKIT